MIHLRIIMLSLLISVVFSSCGGGGGGGGNQPSTPVVSGTLSSSSTSSLSISSSIPASSASSSSKSTLPSATLNNCPTDNIPSKYAYTYRIIGTTLYYDGNPVAGVNGCDVHIFNENFYSDSQFVYFEKYKMPEADKATFGLLADTDLAKDKNNVYQYSTSSGIYPNIISHDGAHFAKLNDTYYKDSSKIYTSDGNPLIGADYSTFVVVSEGFAKDKIGFFYGSQRAKFKSDKITSYDDGYLSDGVNIYLYGRKTNIPAQEFVDLGYGIAKSNSAVYFYGNKTDKTYDAPSFQALSEAYIKDKNNIYINPEYTSDPNANNIIVGADQATFKVVKFEDANHNSTSYAKDKNGIYLGTKLSTTIDANTYEVIGFLYSKDKNNVYLFGDRKIANADPATFTLISEESYAKDKSHIFYYDNILKDADLATFELLDNEYSRDKNSVYKGQYKIDGADPATFVIFSYDLSKDKNGVYYNQTKVATVDTATMKYFSGDYYYDKNNFYSKDKIISGVDVSEPIIAIGDRIFKNKTGIFVGDGEAANVDASSFTNLNNGFYKDSTNIYTSELAVVTTDVTHFTVISSNPDDYTYYVKDNSNVYYIAHGSVYTFTGADAKTFEVISNEYTRDSTKVFFNNTPPKELVGLNPNTLQILANSIVTDGSLIFEGDKQLTGADPATFDVSNHYPIDATHVYCDGNNVLSGISTSNLSFLDNVNYFKIGTKLYYQCKEVVGFDLASLQNVGIFIKDSNHVYYGATVYTWSPDITADAKTFVKVAGVNDFYKDKNHIYSSTSMVLNADTATFEQISEDYKYFKDKDHIYFNTKTLNADVATFIKFPGDNGYFKDKDHIFYNGAVLLNADVATFAKFPGDNNYYRDNLHVFDAWGSLIENADPNTFDPNAQPN